MDCIHSVPLHTGCVHCKELQDLKSALAHAESTLDLVREENGALRAAAERQAMTVTPKYPQRWCRCGLVESDDAWRRSGDSRGCPDCQAVWPENLWRRDDFWRKEVVVAADEHELALREFAQPRTNFKRVLRFAESKVEPSHYGGKDNPYEAIKVIEAWKLGFCLGNTVKYISRAGKKAGELPVEDLEKARWYLDREIQRIKKGEG